MEQGCLGKINQSHREIMQSFEGDHRRLKLKAAADMEGADGTEMGNV